MTKYRYFSKKYEAFEKILKVLLLTTQPVLVNRMVITGNLSMSTQVHKAAVSLIVKSMELTFSTRQLLNQNYRMLRYLH